MNFSEYRSKALQALWPRIKREYNFGQRWIVSMEKFSTWEVDNICAMNWKYNNPLSSCVEGLISYIETEVIACNGLSHKK